MQIFEIASNDSRFTINGVSLTIPDEGQSTFVLSFDVKFLGKASIEASGSSRSLAKAVDIQLDVSGYAGKLFIAFNNSSILVTSSTMPEIVFDVYYGEQVMKRLSNLSLLVLKSLMNSHLLYPNCVPIVFRDELIDGQKAIEIPVSLFNPAFFKIQFICLHIPDSALEDHAFASCYFMFAGQKVRTETSPILPETRWSFTHKFPLPVGIVTAESFPFSVKIYTKKKKSGQSALLEELHFDVNVSSSGSLICLKAPLNRIPGAHFFTESILITPELCKSLIPFSKGEALASQGSKKYLNGMSWSNLKTALQTLASNPSKFENAIAEDISHFDTIEVENSNMNIQILARLRFYESQIIQILRFLSDHSESLEDKSSLEQIQSSLEAFRSDIARMIESYPETSHTVDEISSIMQSFIDLVTQKIAKIDENDQSKEVLQPIETHLRSFLPAEDFRAGPSSDAGETEPVEMLGTPTKLKQDIYLQETLAFSAPLISSMLTTPHEGNIVESMSSDYMCHIGPRPVSLVLGDESMYIEDLQNYIANLEPHTFNVFSLAESYGLDLSSEAIETHQFTKKWSLTIDEDRLTLTQSTNTKHFPYLCVNMARLIKVKVFGAPMDKNSAAKASFIEIYYLQDEEQNIVEYQKLFADPSEIAKIFELLQPIFLIGAGFCQVQWSAIEKVDITASTMTIFTNTTYDAAGNWDAIKIGRFFGALDMHDAYVDIQARLHRRGRGLSPSMSPLSLSTTSFAMSLDDVPKSFSSYQLYRPSIPLLGREIHQYSLNNFGLVLTVESIAEYTCSYMRRGISIGRLVVTPRYLCFNGKRNGVRTSKMVARWNVVESIELQTRWYSRGFALKLEDADEPFFFFAFKKDSVLECVEKITQFIEDVQK